MDEKNLKIILGILPVVIIALAVIFPLYTSGWDFEKALYGTDPTAVIESFEPAGTGGQGGLFTPQNFELSDDRVNIILSGELKNPFSEDITLTELTYTVLIGGESSELVLAEGAQIPSLKAGAITLGAPVTENQKKALLRGEKISPATGSLTGLAFEMHGIKVVSGGAL